MRTTILRRLVVYEGSANRGEFSSKESCDKELSRLYAEPYVPVYETIKPFA